MESSPELGATEEDAQASQVLEILNGSSLEPFRAEAAEGGEVWSAEMGDDSVFYSDEEQAQLGTEAVAVGDSGAKRRHQLVNSVAETDSEPKNHAGEMVSEGPSEAVWIEVINCKRMHRSEPEDLETESDETPEKFVRNCVEFLRNEMQTEHELDEAEVHQQPRDKKLKAEDRPAHLNGHGYTSLKGDEAAADKPADHSLQTQHELPQSPDELNPFPAKHADSSPFNHLASSKYSTVSYRRIQRGNTRQKIEEFEFKVMNQ